MGPERPTLAPMRIRLSLLALCGLVACRPQQIAPIVPSLPPSIPPLAGTEQIALALRYIDGLVGTGPAVSAKQCVFVHYTGWLRNGTKFDSSRDTMPNGTPRTPIGFPLGLRRVIAGWDLGLEGMRVGGQRRLFIPFPLAYGEAGRPPVIPERAELIFDTEVMAVSDTLSRAESVPQRGPTPQCPTWAAVKDRVVPAAAPPPAP
jgi:peptidylprolyl isomerase